MEGMDPSHGSLDKPPDQSQQMVQGQSMQNGQPIPLTMEHHHPHQHTMHHIMHTSPILDHHQQQQHHPHPGSMIQHHHLGIEHHQQMQLHQPGNNSGQQNQPPHQSLAHDTSQRESNNEVKEAIAVAEEEEDTKDNIPNPWDAANTLKEFCFYCCPECDFKSKSEQPFHSHAAENHPKAKQLLTIVEQQKLIPDVNIKVEDMSFNGDEDVPASSSSKSSKSKKSKSKKRQKQSQMSHYYYDEYDESYDPDYDPYWGGGEDYYGYDDPYAMSSAPKRRRKPKVDDADKPHACDSCDSRYTNLYALAIHKAYLHGDGNKGSFKCPACDTIETTSANLKEHIQLSHENVGVKTKSESGDDEMQFKVEVKADGEGGANMEHKCPRCDLSVKGLWNLTMHLRHFHSGAIGDLDCPVCPHKAANKRMVKIHIQRVHEKNYLPCPGCGKMILDISLNAHIKRNHSQTSEIHRCEEEGCDFVAKDKGALWQHTKFKHREHKFICDLCGKTFPFNALLQKHRNLAHFGVKKHVCDKCGKSFSEPGLFRQHAAHPCDFLTRRDKTYECDECEDKFDMLKGYIFHHKRVHNSFPPNVGDIGELHLCDQCPAVYLGRMGLKLHKERKHLGKPARKEKKRTYTCQHCGQHFTQKLNLEEHVLVKHENSTPYKCEQCTKAYGTEKMLKIHMHNTHRRPKCEICGKEICNNLWLKRHMAKVHGVIPENSFPCEVCTFVFDNEENKRKHMLKQHAAH